MENPFKKSGSSSFSSTNAKYNYHIPPTTVLSGWRYYTMIGGLIGTIALMVYPIIVDPILHVDKYKKAHKEAQTELFQAGLLPGQGAKWKSPWSKDDK